MNMPVIERAKTWLSGITSSDSWQNRVTGMGIIGRDKGESTTFGAARRLDRTTLDELGRDGLAKKIVDRIVDDAMRGGWVVSFTGDEDADISTEQAVEYNDRLTNWYKRIKIKRTLTTHFKYARRYGGSLLAIGAEDGGDASMPLNPESVTRLSWLRTHDRYQVAQSGNIEGNPSSKDFGYPESYYLYSSTSLGVANRTSNEQMLNVPVHASRLWRTDGVVSSERERDRNEGWGDSVLEACWEPLSNWASGMKSARTTLQDYTQGVYGIKNLPSIIMANGDEEVRKRWALGDFLKSMHNAIMIDADNESYNRITTSLAGMSDIIDRNAMHLSAVSGMPMTLLFGLSPSGFGTGEAEGDNWDDSVSSFQTDNIQPLLEYVLGLLFRTKEFADFPKNWSIKFAPLKLMSQSEEADIRLKTSQADAIDIQSQVLGPDEVARSRYGGASYSTETKLDERSREIEQGDGDERREGTMPDGIEAALLGQIIDLHERVKSGTVEKSAAMALLGMLMPSADQAKIAGLLPVDTPTPDAGLFDNAPLEPALEPDTQ